LSLRVGKIAGIDVKLHYTWLIIFLLIVWSVSTAYMPLQYPKLPLAVYWSVGAITALILLFSVLIHELFHSLVAKRMGLPVPRITLFLFGGVSEIAEEPKDPIVELKMASAGPLSSLLLSAIFGLGWLSSNMAGSGAVIKAPLQYGFTINLMLALFNLIPAFPMDGGRILRALLWRRKNDVIKATKISATVAEGFSYLFMLSGFAWLFLGGFINGLWLIFIGWFLKSGAEASLRQTIIGRALARVKVKNIMSAPVCTADPNLSLMEAVENCFYKYKHGGFPIVEGERLVGIITLEDVKKVPRERWNEVLVKEVMTPSEKILFIEPEDSAVEALVKMSKFGVGRLPVMEDGKLVGIVTRSDIIHALRTKSELG